MNIFFVSRVYAVSILSFASHGALSAAAGRDDESGSDRAERRVANAHQKLGHSDDPHGRHRSFPTARRLVAQSASRRPAVIDLGSLRDHTTVFQFFYLERDTRPFERDSGKRGEDNADAEGAVAPKIHPAQKPQ